jgi:hypothetical protein
VEIRTVGRRLTLVVLLAQLPMGSLQAQDSAAFTLAPGEIRWVHIGSSYRDIRICNDVASKGDLTAIVGEHQPLVLVPGRCKWEHGDRMLLRNDSNAPVNGLYQVTGVHQS